MDNHSDYKNWTLFLDRDGVINHRIPGSYVQSWDEFHFIEDSLEAIVSLSQMFGRVLVVTNQQGIGKGMMTTQQLAIVHQKLQQEVLQTGGHIDKIYHCSELAIHNPICRKPNPGMAYQAKEDFPEINFHQSIMVGDSISDIEFGIRLGMQTILIEGKSEELEKNRIMAIDWRFDTLASFALHLKKSLL